MRLNKRVLISLLFAVFVTSGCGTAKPVSTQQSETNDVQAKKSETPRRTP
jgi:hypothetical protein